ncbi:hypothetical protein CK203_096132 [Vitis vinifera]|uniref:UBN2 domain-containing protein n=1 Tax=Vitis vinifera TaxID=29760 RepID=A0A438DV75_VITVI|nr:hypothetical protein CK203_096132 [Vitis vinifera]
MEDNATIVEMITRFTDIVNGLEALGKTYKESEKVMKILRSLPSKWHTKVTAIQEAKDLTKLPLEELIGSLMTYEINLAKMQQEGEDKKKKSIALKATTKEEEKQSKEDEDLTFITRKFNKFIRGEKFRGIRFTSRRDLSKKESSSHSDKERWEEKRDLVCFKCKKLGYIKYDSPLYKSEAKRRKKKTMMATWSESEESSEEEKDKEVANMCFMAIDELEEVNSNLSDEELYEDFEKLSLKNISLKKKVQQPLQGKRYMVTFITSHHKHKVSLQHSVTFSTDTIEGTNW